MGLKRSSQSTNGSADVPRRSSQSIAFLTVSAVPSSRRRRQTARRNGQELFPAHFPELAMGSSSGGRAQPRLVVERTRSWPWDHPRRSAGHTLPAHPDHVINPRPYPSPASRNRGTSEMVGPYERPDPRECRAGFPFLGAKRRPAFNFVGEPGPRPVHQLAGGKGRDVFGEVIVVAHVLAKRPTPMPSASTCSAHPIGSGATVWIENPEQSRARYRFRRNLPRTPRVVVPCTSAARSGTARLICVAPCTIT